MKNVFFLFHFQDSDENELQGSHGVRRRNIVQKIEPGSLNVLSAKYEVRRFYNIKTGTKLNIPFHLYLCKLLKIHVFTFLLSRA